MFNTDAIMSSKANDVFIDFGKSECYECNEALDNMVLAVLAFPSKTYYFFSKTCNFMSMLLLDRIFKFLALFCNNFSCALTILYLYLDLPLLGRLFCSDMGDMSDEVLDCAP